MKEHAEMDFLKKMPHVLDAWTASVKKDPDRLWIHDSITPSGFSRREADELSSRVYRYLKEKGIGREDFVMICLPRSAFVFIAMLGVWKAGAAVVITDEEYSEERIRYIYTDCRCRIKVDMDCWQEMVREKPLGGFESVSPSDAAYAVYTSGSTGNPKGVLQEYGKIRLDNLSVQNSRVEIFHELTRFALVSPLNFVAGIKSATYTMYYGASLYIVPTAIVKNPTKLRNYLKEHLITCTFLAPSILRVADRDFGGSLKTIVTGSESANELFFEGVTLINNYGMSEAGFSVTQFIVDKPYDITPIGKPNYEKIPIRILNEDGSPVKDGEKGEICFHNPFFRGYINLPGETEAAFKNGIFHTGDIGMRLPDGNVIITGRKTEMLKINGNRVEPSEIETCARNLLSLDWCCVKGFIDTKETILCLYYTGALSLSTALVREKLGEQLPYYMLPTHVMHLDTIPMLPNNKVNKKALPKPETLIHTAPYLAPVTETEKKLCRAFENVFHGIRVGIDDDFFALGGDSIRAMSLLRDTEIDGLEVMDIYSGGTVRKIAAIVDEKRRGETDVPLEEQEKAARQTPQMLTPTQTLFFDMQLFDHRKSVMYMSFFFESESLEMAQTLCEAANLVSRHRPVFSSVIEFNGGGYLQYRYDPKIRRPIELEDVTEEEMRELIDSAVPAFQIMKEPLYRLRLFRTDKKLYLHLLTSHINGDGSLNQMIIKDLLAATRGDTLEPDTGYLFLKRTREYILSDLYMEHHRYYEDALGNVDWCCVPPFDPKGDMKGFGMIPAEWSYDPEVLALFESRNHISKQNLLILVCLLALSRITGKTDVQYIWTFSNRMDQVSANAGCGTMNMLPISLRLGRVHTREELFAAFRKEYDISMKYHHYPWFANHCSGLEHSAFVYETNDIVGTENLSQLTFRQVKSHSFDPEGYAGFIQYQMVYEKPSGFRIMNIFNSSKIRREIMEEFVREQRLVFDMLMKDDDQKAEDLWHEKSISS